MKRKVYFTAALLVFAGFAGAVVYENGSSPSNNVEDGEMRITSAGSTASGTTAVGPNGTQYSSSVAMAGRTGEITNESVTAPVFSESGNMTQLEFNGSITSSDLCQVIDQETKKVGEESFVLNVKTVKDELENGTYCGQQLTMINYEAEFEHERPYELKVLHNGEEVETFQAEDIAGPEPPAKEPDFVSKIVNFFQGLF